MKFDLAKDTAKAKFILEKRNLPSITAEVVLDLDISGSTKDLYLNGTMQEAVQRVLPVAINFDDNGEVPVYVFNDGDAQAQVGEMLTSSNYTDYVRKSILDNRMLPKWGATAYAPVLRSNLLDLGFIRKPMTMAPATASTTAPISIPAGRRGGLFGAFTRLFGAQTVPKTGPETGPSPTAVMEDPENETAGLLCASSTTGLPAIIYMVTDGVNSDIIATDALIEDCIQIGVRAYFNFIGVGNERFRFLHQIADVYPNVGFTHIRDLASAATSDDIYEHLLPTELTDWLRPFIKGTGSGASSGA